jgi:hypothetical protein
MEKAKYLIAMIAYPAWHPLVNMVLSHCRRKGIISDSQWHEISAKLDRTQVHCCLEKASRRALA